MHTHNEDGTSITMHFKELRLLTTFIMLNRFKNELKLIEDDDVLALKMRKFTLDYLNEISLISPPDLLSFFPHSVSK